MGWVGKGRDKWRGKLESVDRGKQWIFVSAVYVENSGFLLVQCWCIVVCILLRLWEGGAGGGW